MDSSLSGTDLANALIKVFSNIKSLLYTTVYSEELTIPCFILGAFKHSKHTADNRSPAPVKIDRRIEAISVNSKLINNARTHKIMQKEALIFRKRLQQFYLIKQSICFNLEMTLSISKLRF